MTAMMSNLCAITRLESANSSRKTADNFSNRKHLSRKELLANAGHTVCCLQFAVRSPISAVRWSHSLTTDHCALTTVFKTLCPTRYVPRLPSEARCCPRSLNRSLLPPKQTPTFRAVWQLRPFTFASRNRLLVPPNREALGQRSRHSPADIAIAAGDAL